MKIPQEYKTIFILVIGFAIISFLWKIKWLFYFSIGILFISLMNKSVAKRIARLWMNFGKFIGTINSKIILSVFYLLILVPMATLKKIAEAKPKTNQKTKWINVDENERNNFNNPW